MAADQREALIRAYIDEVFNRHRVDALDKYWDDDLTSHWLGMETIHGLPDWRAAMEGFFAAFPDAAYTLDDMFFAGDRGVWRGHWQATQQGEWQGIAASGRNVRWTVIIIGRFAGGTLMEDWVELDRLGLFSSSDAFRPGRRWGQALRASRKLRRRPHRDRPIRRAVRPTPGAVLVLQRMNAA